MQVTFTNVFNFIDTSSLVFDWFQLSTLHREPQTLNFEPSTLYLLKAYFGWKFDRLIHV